MTEETPKAQVFDNEHDWVIAAMDSKLKAFMVSIDGNTHYGLAVSKLQFMKALVLPDVVQVTKTDLGKRAKSVLKQFADERRAMQESQKEQPSGV